MDNTKKLLRALQAEAMLTESCDLRAYLTGFFSSFGYVYTDWEESVFFTDPRYAEGCHMLERIGNMLDILACGTPQERAEVVADLQKDDRLMRMEARNRQIREDKYGTK